MLAARYGRRAKTRKGKQNDQKQTSFKSMNAKHGTSLIKVQPNEIENATIAARTPEA